MRKEYVSPEIKIKLINFVDILTTSDQTEILGDDEFDKYYKKDTI